ncbi:hypothetical protein [Streptomyces asiaticus]|uniref:hypothetical protein n=1 Tax=Streptomyces asiaticus TaxID=114695 RepID=UPI003F67D723
MIAQFDERIDLQDCAQERLPGGCSLLAAQLLTCGFASLSREKSCLAQLERMLCSFMEPPVEVVEYPLQRTGRRLERIVGTAP